jgi:hypothetical protein
MSARAVDSVAGQSQEGAVVLGGHFGEGARERGNNGNG